MGVTRAATGRVLRHVDEALAVERDPFPGPPAVTDEVDLDERLELMVWANTPPSGGYEPDRIVPGAAVPGYPDDAPTPDSCTPDFIAAAVRSADRSQLVGELTLRAEVAAAQLGSLAARGRVTQGGRPVGRWFEPW